MNLLQAIYCNQYAELKRTNRNVNKARTNGIILITSMIIVNLFTVLVLFFAFNKQASQNESLGKFAASLGGGRSAGQVIAILLFAIIGAFISSTVGKWDYYSNTIRQFETLEIAEQKKTERKATVYVLGSVFSFIIIFFVCLFL